MCAVSGVRTMVRVVGVMLKTRVAKSSSVTSSSWMNFEKDAKIRFGHIDSICMYLVIGNH